MTLADSSFHFSAAKQLKLRFTVLYQCIITVAYAVQVALPVSVMALRKGPMIFLHYQKHFKYWVAVMLLNASISKL